MDKSYFELLFDYDRWATGRVLRQAATLTAAEYSAPVLSGGYEGTIHSALGHCLGAEVIWLARCQGISPRAILSGKDFPTVDALIQRWSQHHAEMAAFLAKLSDADLDRPVSYQTMAGPVFIHRLAHMLAHMVNHSTQYRSEAAVGLTHFGHSPGDLDLIVYVREKGIQ